MGQSITSAQTTVNARTLPNTSWTSVLSSLWSVFTSIRLLLISSVQYLIGFWRSDISTTLNVDRVSAQLAVERRARVDGTNERPASSEEVVAGTQREIVAYFKGLQRRARNEIPAQAERLRGRGEKIEIREAAGTLPSAGIKGRLITKKSGSNIHS